MESDSTERLPNGRVISIGKDEYVAHFAELKHVFLVGDLQKSCPHPFVRDERVEIIVCSYLPGDDGLRHWHQTVTEYELVLEGEIGVFEIATGETRWFAAGDFIVVPAGQCVQRIVRQATKTVAVKAPSSNEKIHCDECPRECAWRVEPYVESNEGI